MLISQLCTYESLSSSEFRAWSDRLRPVWDPAGDDPREFMAHRKMWEWSFIAQALAERGMLQRGKRGLAFGVGKEPLVSLFASMGPEVLATDIDARQAIAGGWTPANEQYAGSLENLNQFKLCPDSEFAHRVTYRTVDMNAIPSDLRDFDFTWSSCALEHLGSLEAGLKFLLAQMDCLRPGGVGVHTTEFAVSSRRRTLKSGATVLFRKRDIQRVVRLLRRRGHVIDLDLTEGDHPADRHVDVPPFSNTHLRTALGAFTTTSLGLIIQHRA